MHQTTSQQRAIETLDRNLMVVAGAGSGKTYVLVQRYMKLLEAHPEWPVNTIVAITFTQKAAQEMRDRVRQTVEARYANATTLHEAEQWAGRLNTLNSARIDTIHGLCTSILRANAAAVGIDPAFEVLDEVQARVRLDDVIDRTFQELRHAASPLMTLFTEYDSYTIRRMIVQFIGASLPDLPQDVMTMWQALWERLAVDTLSRLIHSPTTQSFASWEPDSGWPTQEDKLGTVWVECRDLLARVSAADVALQERLQALEALPDQINLRSGSAKHWGTKETLEMAKQVLGDLRDAARAALATIGTAPDVNDQRAAELLPLWQRLITLVQSRFQADKQADSVLDFNDLEQYTQRLLTSNPGVRARYQQEEFKHVMIDEFQDTNADQWAIAQGLADLDIPGSLFVVGDPKQSIYAFRGADVSVFGAVQNAILAHGGESISLSESFRTHEPLVNAFNQIFSELLRPDASSPVQEYEVDFGEAMQANRPTPPDPSAPIELLLITDESDLDTAARRTWEAVELCRYLQDMVTAGRLIYDRAQQHTRPIRYGDMAILFQSMSHVTDYEAVFKAHGLPFVTVAGRGYYDRQEVWDMLNLLSALHNPYDDLALASVLRSPLYGVSDEVLLALRLQRTADDQRMPLWEALHQTAAEPTLLPYIQAFPQDMHNLLVEAAQSLTKLRLLAGRVTIAELMRTALDERAYLAVLLGLPDGARRRGNVEKLIEKAEHSSYISLGAFSHYVRDLSEREVREGEALVDVQDAVTLMTIHASKGLEFPLVVLVDAGWTRGNETGSPVMHDSHIGMTCKVYDEMEDKMVSPFAQKWAEQMQILRERAERKRLLYVAATRAQDYLVISGQLKRLGTESWLRWLLNALAIDTPTTETRHYEWGTLNVRVLSDAPGDSVIALDGSDGIDPWDAGLAEIADTGGLSIPAMLTPIPFDSLALTHHITATQIMDAGSAGYDPFFRQRFRRSVLHDAPAVIHSVTEQDPTKVSRRVLGDIVHQVLRWGRYPDNTENYEKMLDHYAWELGVVDPAIRQQTAKEALHLVESTMQSDIMLRLRQARLVYREIPFIYQSDKHIVNGVIDVLFQDPDGQWNVLDYKTSLLKTNDLLLPNANLLKEHARRYHLQIGVYAAAAQAQIQSEQPPQTYIHYIRYGYTVPIPEADWTAALHQLEPIIGDLLQD
jgi:ATP-dependent helicase/nuclease subunit A